MWSCFDIKCKVLKQCGSTWFGLSSSGTKTSWAQSPRTPFLNLGAWTAFEFKSSNALRSTWADKFFRRKWNKAIWWKFYCAVPCHSRYFTFTLNFFSINLKVTAICLIFRLSVIIIHLFISRTIIYKDLILKET